MKTRSVEAPTACTLQRSSAQRLPADLICGTGSHCITAPFHNQIQLMVTVGRQVVFQVLSKTAMGGAVVEQLTEGHA